MPFSPEVPCHRHLALLAFPHHHHHLAPLNCSRHHLALSAYPTTDRQVCTSMQNCQVFLSDPGPQQQPEAVSGNTWAGHVRSPAKGVVQPMVGVALKRTQSEMVAGKAGTTRLTLILALMFLSFNNPSPLLDQ